MATGPGSYSRHKFLSELNTPLSTAAGIKAPSTQRAEVIANIFGAGGTLADPGIAGDVLFQDDVTIAGTLTNTASAGTVGEVTVTAVEYGSYEDHTTVLTLTAFAAGTSGDATSVGLGALLYTFPAGKIAVEWAQLLAVGVTAAISVTTDTPEIGLGTVVATGAIATLGAGAATMENISEGGDTTNIAPDVAGTATINSSKRCTPGTGDDGPLIIAAASVHTVYLNLADAWANVTAAGAVTVDGTIVIKWTRLTAS